MIKSCDMCKVDMRFTDNADGFRFYFCTVCGAEENGVWPSDAMLEAEGAKYADASIKDWIESGDADGIDDESIECCREELADKYVRRRRWVRDNPTHPDAIAKRDVYNRWAMVGLQEGAR